MQIKETLKPLRKKVNQWKVNEFQKSNDRQLELLIECWALAKTIEDDPTNKEAFIKFLKDPQPDPRNPGKDMTLRWQGNSRVFTFLVRLLFPFKAKTACNYCSAFVYAEKEVSQSKEEISLLDWMKANGGLNGVWGHARGELDNKASKKREKQLKEGENRLSALTPFLSAENHDGISDGEFTIIIARNSASSLDFLLELPPARFKNSVLKYLGGLTDKEYLDLGSKLPSNSSGEDKAKEEDLGEAA